MRTRCILVLGLGLGLVAPSVRAADWPQWRGANRDGKVTGFTAPSAWPKELTKKWKTTVGLGDSSPALVGNRAYAFTRQGKEEVTTCLNAETGKPLWQDKYAAPEVTGPPSSHPGPRSSPAVGQGKVCTLGVAGVLSCLNAATGAVVWRKDSKAWPDFYTAYSPLIVDGKCIAYLGGRGTGTLSAFDLTTGDEKWKWTGDGPSYGSPVLVTIGGIKQLVTPTEKSLLGISVADGRLLWQTPFQGGRFNTGTPVVDGQTVICSGRAFTIEKQGDVLAAKELWKGEAPSQFNTPVLRDGLLYGLSGRRNLFCVDAKTGAVAWTDPTPRGECGAILDVGTALLALTSSTELVAFKPDRTAYTELAKYKAADTPTWAYPVVVGNRILVKDADSLTLWTLP